MSDKAHAMLVDEDHDEHARMSFVATWKTHISHKISGGNRTIYKSRVEGALNKALGRAPRREDIHRAMKREPYWQMTSALKRNAQEMMWDATAEVVTRQQHDLIDRYRNIAGGNRKKGTLRLDPTLEIPRYISAVDIHLMPGNYHSDPVADDVFAGAIYDRGVQVFRMLPTVTLNEGSGDFTMRYFRERFPSLKPRRILDMGCSVGHSTSAIWRAFPEAEVHGIDVGAPMLRYAHARAEDVGYPIHFSQQNAEATDFPDGYFDAVISYGMTHETSNKALRAIFRESHRILARGGVMMHGGGLQYHEVEPYEQFVTGWDTHYNAEPFIDALHDLDLQTLIIEAGFRPENYFEGKPLRNPQRIKVDASAQSNDYNLGGAYLFCGGVRE